MKIVVDMVPRELFDYRFHELTEAQKILLIEYIIICRRMKNMNTENSDIDSNRGFIKENVLVEDTLSALKYYPSELSEEQFDYCVKLQPRFALGCCSDRLSEEQFDYCIKRDIVSAFRYFKERLSQEQLDYCIRKEPYFGLKYAAEKLSKEQLEYCKRKS